MIFQLLQLPVLGFRVGPLLTYDKNRPGSNLHFLKTTHLISSQAWAKRPFRVPIRYPHALYLDQYPAAPGYFSAEPATQSSGEVEGPVSGPENTKVSPNSLTDCPVSCSSASISSP